jgi:hypothetical protein
MLPWADESVSAILSVQPFQSICITDDGEYDVQLFQGVSNIRSPIFANLMLSAMQIFVTGQYLSDPGKEGNKPQKSE